MGKMVPSAESRAVMVSPFSMVGPFVHECPQPPHPQLQVHPVGGHHQGFDQPLQQTALLQREKLLPDHQKPEGVRYFFLPQRFTACIMQGSSKNGFPGKWDESSMLAEARNG